MHSPFRSPYEVPVPRNPLMSDVNNNSVRQDSAPNKLFFCISRARPRSFDLRLLKYVVPTNNATVLLTRAFRYFSSVIFSDSRDIEAGTTTV